MWKSKLNCEVLWDDYAYEVRWAVAGDSIVLQLVARLENNEYMSFGLSGDPSRSRMVGGDVVVAWVDKESLKGYAKDYILDAKSQCSGGRGSCPDENIQQGTESVRLLNAALVNGYSIVTFQRSLKAQDDLDNDVFTNASQPIIWAVGPLNSRKEVSYHSLANRGDIFIDFGRAPKWNCPTPESVSEQSEPEDPSLTREYEEARIQSARIQDSVRRESRPKAPAPTPAPAPKSGAWEIPPIKCYEPEDGVFYAQMGPTGGKHGYSAITGHVGWGISWYINGLLIPEINVVRGRTYTFIVEGGLDPETPARYHPFYITDDPVGGYQYKTPQERANIQIFAGAVQNKRGEVRPTGVGRLCNWTPDPNSPPADEFTSFGAYQRTLRLECDPGNPGIIQWTVEKDTPDTVYYQCYTHRYLGWKINVHDSCEGEAGSAPVPSVVKAPASIIQAYETDTEGSESINFETRVKPDADFLKNFAEKSQTKFGPNELSHGTSNKPYSNLFGEEIKSTRNEINAIVKHQVVPQGPIPHFQYPEVQVLVQQQKLHVPQQSFVPDNSFMKFSTATLPGKSSGYSVTEESVEGNSEQNFQIIPVSLPQTSHLLPGYENRQKFVPGELIRVPEKVKNGIKEEYSKNQEILRVQTEEKLKRNNHKPPYYSKVTNRLPGNPNRVRKPLPSGPVTLQKRPFPPGAFRPPSLSHVPQKRPVPLAPHKNIHHAQAKPLHSHQRVNIALGPEDFGRQETQLIQQNKRPNKQPQNFVFSSHDLFGSSTVNKPSSQNIPFAQNNGFDPQSVQVEGGFKPILNTGIGPKTSLIDRSDLEIAENADDKVGIIDLVLESDSSESKSSVKRTQETSEFEKSLIGSEDSKEKEVDLFKNQKPQTFEPIFIPSYPDDSVKKYQEKYKKKPALSLKPRYDQFQSYDSVKSGQIYVKIRPSTNLIRKPLYPDDVVPPFKIPHHGGTPQLRSQTDGFEKTTSQVESKDNNTSNRNVPAENILELLQMYEEKNNETEANTTMAADTDGTSEAKFKADEIVQDEIAMADQRKDFYLPPKPEEFRSYDGRVVKTIEAPTLPEKSVPADVSKLPQFVPFKGAIPSLTPTVNARNLPQLRSSKLARHEILPPSESDVGSVTSKTSETHKRQKRSPDHIPGHEGHHHHHDGHDHHSSGSSAKNNLWQLAFLSFTLLCLQREIAL